MGENTVFGHILFPFGKRKREKRKRDLLEKDPSKMPCFSLPLKSCCCFVAFESAFFESPQTHCSKLSKSLICTYRCAYSTKMHFLPDSAVISCTSHMLLLVRCSLPTTAQLVTK